jgi:hypothetical protein
MMLYCTVHALGELAVLFPVAGSFSAYSTRFIDPVSLTFMGAKLPIPDCIRTSFRKISGVKFPNSECLWTICEETLLRR